MTDFFMSGEYYICKNTILLHDLFHVEIGVMFCFTLKQIVSLH